MYVSKTTDNECILEVLRQRMLCVTSNTCADCVGFYAYCNTGLHYMLAFVAYDILITADKACTEDIPFFAGAAYRQLYVGRLYLL